MSEQQAELAVEFEFVGAGEPRKITVGDQPLIFIGPGGPGLVKVLAVETSPDMLTELLAGLADAAEDMLSRIDDENADG